MIQLFMKRRQQEVSSGVKSFALGILQSQLVFEYSLRFLKMKPLSICIHYSDCEVKKKKKTGKQNESDCIVKIEINSKPVCSKPMFCLRVGD